MLGELKEAGMVWTAAVKKSMKRMSELEYPKTVADFRKQRADATSWVCLQITMEIWLEVI